MSTASDSGDTWALARVEHLKDQHLSTSKTRPAPASMNLIKPEIPYGCTIDFQLISAVQNAYLAGFLEEL